MFDNTEGLMACRGVPKDSVVNTSPSFPSRRATHYHTVTHCPQSTNSKVLGLGAEGWGEGGGAVGVAERLEDWKGEKEKSIFKSQANLSFAIHTGLGIRP